MSNSNSNAASRIAPKITLSKNPEEDFNFYLQFVISLVPKLPEFKERKLAGEWVQKLVEDKSNPERRTEYLLLLLFALQRRQLSGPFLNSPSKSEALKPFEDDLDMFSMMERMATQRRNIPTTSPYYSEISGDFKEYAVTQEIPNHGIHCYLATSNEPIEKWKNSHLAHIPKELPHAEPQTPHGSLKSSAPTPDLDGEDDKDNFSVVLRTLQRQHSKSCFIGAEVEDAPESYGKAHPVGPTTHITKTIGPAKGPARDTAYTSGPTRDTAYTAGPARENLYITPSVRGTAHTGGPSGSASTIRPSAYTGPTRGPYALEPARGTYAAGPVVPSRIDQRQLLQPEQGRQWATLSPVRESTSSETVTVIDLSSPISQRVNKETDPSAAPQERTSKPYQTSTPRSSQEAVSSDSLQRLMAEFEQRLQSENARVSARQPGTRSPQGTGRAPGSPSNRARPPPGNRSPTRAAQRRYL